MVLDLVVMYILDAISLSHVSHVRELALQWKSYNVAESL